MKNFIVTLRFQYPAWDEKDGIPYEIAAKTKTDAIKKARRQAENDGHSGPWVKDGGKKTFTAVEVGA